MDGHADIRGIIAEPLCALRRGGTADLYKNGARHQMNKWVIVDMRGECLG